MTTTLTARSPEDLLAMVPVVLGFVPTDSVVMLTFGAARTFHARVDLPPSDASVDDVVTTLCEPAVRHGVRRVVFVVYGDARPAERVARRLVRAFCDAGVVVIDVIRADGCRWFPMWRRRPGADPAGTPYDLSTHPFTVQAVVDGRVTHGSRAELADSIRTDPVRAARVAAAAVVRDEVRDPLWVQRTAGRHTGSGTVPPDAEAARLLRAVATDAGALRGLCSSLTRATAAGQVALWTDLVRRAPDAWLPAAASVLALVAWLAGQGALAWCAVDRAMELEPGHDLAEAVGHLLAAAVAPAAWDDVRALSDPA